MQEKLAMQENPAMTQVNLVGNLARMSTIHLRIKRLREAKGLSMEQLADAVSVSWQTVQQWENGKTAPQRKRLGAVASALGTSAEYLLLGDLHSGPRHGTDEGRLETEVQYVGKYDRERRRMPVVGIAQLGENGYYELLDYPKGHGDGYIMHTSADPDAYVLQVRGDSMTPAIRNGWYVVVEPNGAIAPGEYVVVQLQDGRKMVKELLVQHRLGDLDVMSVNGSVRISLRSSDVESVQSVGAVIPPSRVFSL